MKKAQMKIQQTAFMLIAVTLFFALVGMFILGFKLSGLKESKDILEEENAMLLVSKLANSPEFSCENAFGSKTNCIDLDKIIVLKEKLSEYKDFWGISNIEIRKIYPSGNTICTDNNYPNCNRIILKLKEGEGIYTSNFVSLCRKESEQEELYDKCELGKIMVSFNE